ncbi:MAG: hypothetical protein LBP76_03985 [Treponema sp.]|jgi:hypothetical protein|nr:hypothetical protein [Treponema sp.]
MSTYNTVPDHARFLINTITGSHVCLDEDPAAGLPIMEDTTHVLNTLRQSVSLEKKRVIYKDAAGIFKEIVHENNKAIRVRQIHPGYEFHD